MNIGISDKNRQQVIQKLAVLLANEYVLYTKTLKFHWNVEGKHFGALHAFFKEQYEALFIFADDVAERMRALGSKSTGTLAEFLKDTMLKEKPGKNGDDLDMIAQLLADHEIIIRQLRADVDAVLEYDDAGTNNFLADLLEKHEKMAWMLRAHLGK